MILTILLFIPFAINIIILIQYIYTKNKKFRKIFFPTAIAGFLLLGVFLFLSLFNTWLKKTIDYSLALWLFSGYLMLIALFVKILVFSRIYIRYQDPANFHYNFFGKKVIHSGFMTGKEMKEFMITIPLFLFGGAYFIARLINLIIHGHL